MSKKDETFRVGRDSGTGQFKSVEDAKRDREGSTVERVPKPGHGDTARGNKGGRNK